MIECWAVSLSSASKISAINAKSLSHYIINHVSDFAKDKRINGGEWKYEWISETWFCIKNLEYWKICIDEKDVQWQVYTIISNSTDKKEVGMYPWLKAKEVTSFFKSKLPEFWRNSIKEVWADMSPTIESIIEKLFPNAKIVTDRFHVMKKLLEDVRAVRSRAKTMIKKRIFDEEKEALEKKNQEIKTNEKAKKKRGRPKKERYIAPKHINWETDINVVERLWRQLRKRKRDRNDNQTFRWKIAKCIPELAEVVKAYEYLHKLRIIYDKDLTKKKWKEEIIKWIEEWKKIREKVIEVNNMIRTIERRIETISNYFISRHSNWFAEWLNSRIQRLISMSRWFKNKDYMIYRIIKLFAPWSHLV